MSETTIGLRIKQRRRALGVTQAALAAQVGVSPSYLNLIENGKRAVGGKLLGALARALGASREALSEIGDRRTVEALREIAVDPLVRDAAPSPESAAELLGRFDGWARALVTLHRSWRERDRAAAALADRLNQDPFLSDAVHRILSTVSAIRSTAEILVAVRDIDPDQRERFHRILAEESTRLSDVSRALAGFFDRMEDAGRGSTPAEEVDDFIAARQNHFPALEAAVAELRFAARIEDGRLQSRLVDYLSTRFGVAVERAPSEPGGAAAHYDPTTRRLLVSDSALESTRRFQIARLAVRLSTEDAVAAEIDRAADLRSPEAKARAREALISYGAGAAVMPYDAFHDACERSRYDIEAIARRFAASFEQAAHRMATLRRPGAEGPPLAFMRVDPSGYVTKRLALPGLPLPRLGGACPLWAVYRAFQTPEAMVRQLAEFPSGEQFFVMARAVAKEGASWDRPRHLLAIMLATPAPTAERFVYSDGLALGARARPDPVGPSCRLCVRRACAYRQDEAPMIA